MPTWNAVQMHRYNVVCILLIMMIYVDTSVRMEPVATLGPKAD